MDLLSNIFAAKRFPTAGGGSTTTATTITTATVASAIADIAYGGVGSYVMAGMLGSNSNYYTPGSTWAGSALLYQGGGQPLAYNSQFNSVGYILSTATSLGLTGTWRLLTYSGGSQSYYTMGLFVRIA